MISRLRKGWEKQVWRLVSQPPSLRLTVVGPSRPPVFGLGRRVTATVRRTPRTDLPQGGGLQPDSVPDTKRRWPETRGFSVALRSRPVLARLFISPLLREP